jgi:membrane protease YdiL (CAAX protease family)
VKGAIVENNTIGEPVLTDHDTDIFRRCPWQWRDLVVGLAVVIGYWLVRLLLPKSWFGLAPSYWVLGLAALIQSCVFLAYPLWVVRRRNCGPWKMLGFGRMMKEGWLAPLMAIATLLSVGLLAAGLKAVFPHLVEETPWHDVARSGSLPLMLVIAVFAVTLGPVVEEIFFRGFLYNALRRRRLPAVLAACLQSALFAIMHQYGAYGSVVVFFLGMVLTGIYCWRRTLVAPILTHSCINAVVMAGLVALAVQSANAPVLGVRCSARPDGLLVEEVFPGTAAEREDIRLGDILVTYDGTALSDFRQLKALVRSEPIGKQVHLTIIRQGKKLEKKVILGPRPGL